MYRMRPKNVPPSQPAQLRAAAIPQRGFTLRIAALVLALVQSPICGATIFKCTAKDGSTSYSDAQCPADARSEKVPRAPRHSASIAPSGASGPSQALDPPRVTVQQNGRVTEMSVAGQLAADRPIACVPLEQVGNGHTPPDLYLGVSRCIEVEDYRTGVGLFVLAGIEGRFDAARVADKTAGQAGQVLIMNTFNGLPTETRAKFAAAFTEWGADPKAVAQTCATVARIGYPDYYPKYMILHGIRAFTAKPDEATLEENFDAPATWNQLLTSYLKCPGIPAVPPSTSASQ